jgi:uncharacterized membrane protein YhaH (DUF805 family)
MRRLSVKVFEPLSMWVMIAGIVALCQPWSETLHRYSIAILLAGLIGFSVFSHIRPAARTGPESESEHR